VWTNVTGGGDSCDAANFNNVTEVCEEHFYDVEPSNTNYGSSIVTQFDLAPCEGMDDDWPLMVRSSFERMDANSSQIISGSH
jgi:hypothetical protein